MSELNRGNGPKRRRRHAAPGGFAGRSSDRPATRSNRTDVDHANAPHGRNDSYDRNDPHGRNDQNTRNDRMRTIPVGRSSPTNPPRRRRQCDSLLPSVPNGRVSLWGTVLSEAVKLLGLRSTYWLLGLTMALIPAGAAIAAWARNLMASIQNSSQNPDPNPIPVVPAADFWACIGGFVGTVSLIVGLFGVMTITSEYATKSIQSTLTANPDRIRLLAAKSWTAGALVFTVSAIGLLISWAVVAIMAGQWHWRITPLTDGQRHLPWIIMLGGPLALMLITRMALGIGAIIRSTVGGVLTLIGLITIAPTALSLIVISTEHQWLSVLSDLLPSAALSNFLQGGVDTSDLAAPAVGWTPNWWQSLLILIVWWLAIDIIGTLIFRRTDIR